VLSRPYHLMAPTARVSLEQLQRQQALAKGSEYLDLMLEHLPISAMVINSHRQIVCANRAFAALLRVESLQTVIGRRFGEAAQCAHSDETSAGCGTTEFCATCGAAKAMLASSLGAASCEECRVVSRSLGQDLDLRVWARPFVVGDETFTLCVLLDIAHEKRRTALERIFFHDVLNTAHGVRAIATLIGGASPAEQPELLDLIQRVATQLVEELESQRDLMAMERGEPVVAYEAIESTDLLDAVVEAYRGHDLLAGRTLVVSRSAQRVRFVSDAKLIRRVIGNMTKNALEACPRGATVTLTCDADATTVRFEVRNPTVMPHDVQLQLFQRSFSTKGPGRGLGTYSMKLLTERYLQGRICFTSSESAGTIFAAIYPREPHATTPEEPESA
jgi:Histidine kinase-, DNA gyrase B-, and HSP90-like ATPase